MDKPDLTTNGPHTPAAHTIMFWTLAGLAMALFVPCVLVPVWCETEAILAHEHRAAAAVARLEAQVERNNARIQALLADPIVNERIIRRELNHRPADERVVRFSADEVAALDVELPAPTAAATEAQIPDTRPSWLAGLLHWLPAWPWRKLFAEPDNRTLMLAMAGGLLATAFVLYGPGRPRCDAGFPDH